MNRRYLAAFLAALMIFMLMPLSVLAETSIWDGTVDSGYESGSGTKTDPYVVKTAEQLAYFAQSVNSGEAYGNSYFVLGADIALNDLSQGFGSAVSWEPIGNYVIVTEATMDEPAVNAVFRGSFDGNGYEISGLYCDSDSDYNGLFGYIEYAEISNVKVVDSYISGDYYNGAVVGYAGYSNISECVSSSVVYGIDYNGGIAGAVYGTELKDCYNTGEIAQGSDCGGIVGSSDYSLIENCFNIGDITGYYAVGGIVGYVSGQYYSDAESEGEAAVKNCYNMGNIVGVDNNYGHGGITGIAVDTEITDCHNMGEIASTYDAGGIVGTATDVFVVNCINTGGNTSNPYYGAVLGCDEGNCVFENCYYSETDRLLGVGCTFNGGYLFCTSEYDGVNAVTEEAISKQDSFEGLDFDAVWQLSASGPILQSLADTYRTLYKKVSYETLVPTVDESEKLVTIGGIALEDGDYLPNGADSVTDTAPTDKGYAYFKDGVLYLNNFRYFGEGGFQYGYLYEAVSLSGKVKVHLLGDSIIQMPGEKTNYISAGIANHDNDVIIEGKGSVTINAVFGIACTHGVCINGGKIVIPESTAGIQGEFVEINGGTLDIASETVALRSTQSDVTIKGGEIVIESGKDGFNTKSSLIIYGGMIDISAKNMGVYVYDDFILYDGEITIISDGDGINAGDEADQGVNDGGNGEACIYGGKLTIDAGDDAIDTVYDTEIHGGEVNLNAIDHGVDAQDDVFIYGGKIDVTVGDDGLEAYDEVVIEGGDVYIFAGDFGIHSSYSAVIYGGNIEIISIGDSAIDALEYVELNGGNISLYSEGYNAIYTYSLSIYDGSISIVGEYNGVEAEMFSMNGGACDIYGEYEYGVYCTTFDFISGDLYIKSYGQAVTATEENYNIAEGVIENSYEEEDEYGDYYYIIELIGGDYNNSSDESSEEIPEESAPEPLPGEEKPAVYLGGVMLEDGEYLANGATDSNSKMPSRGGYAYYKDGVLTLNNYAYYGSGYKYDISNGFCINSMLIAEDDLKIVLVGENILANTVSVGDGITAMGDLEIGGEGSLEVLAPEGIFSYGDVVVDGYLTVDAENCGITANELAVNGGMTDIKGVTALNCKTVSLGENMEKTTETDSNVVIEFVEPVKEETSEPEEESSEPIEDETSEPEEESSEPVEDETSEPEEESSEPVEDETSEPDEEPSEPIGLRGDINGNDEIDSLDYILLKRAYFGTYGLNEVSEKLADVNNNGEIESLDYILLKRTYFNTYKISEEIKFVY